MLNRDARPVVHGAGDIEKAVGDRSQGSALATGNIDVWAGARQREDTQEPTGSRYQGQAGILSPMRAIHYRSRQLTKS